MKRILCILLMLLFTLPALAEEASLPEGAPLAEENPHAPFTLTAPESVTRVDNEGSVTYVYGASRVVVIRIERVPDEEPAEALPRMLGQFDPDAVIDQELPMAEGYSRKFSFRRMSSTTSGVAVAVRASTGTPGSISRMSAICR